MQSHSINKSSTNANISPPGESYLNYTNGDVPAASAERGFQDCFTGGDKKFNLSVNPRHDGKKITSNEDYAKAFYSRSLTIAELAGEINQGRAWCCATLRDDYRHGDNFIDAQLIGIDIDANLTIERALELDFVRKYGLFLYTSVSHQIEKDGKPACDRFRLVFALPTPESDPDRYKAAVRTVMREMGESDPACKDAVRYWAGNRSAETKILPGDFLPADFTDRAIARENTERQSFTEQADHWTNSLEKTEKVELVRSALAAIPPRRPGTGTYNESMSVIAALANSFDPGTAIKLAEGWSPSTRYKSGENWHVPTKIRSFRRERKAGGKVITLGTLFYIARSHGWEPPAKWRERQSDDFLKKQWEQWEKYHTLTPDETVNQRWLDIPAPEKGEILIVSSPTNTGKSTLLKKWAKEDLKELGIIRIGNRNSLELQFCAESGFYHLQSEESGDTLFSDPRKRISFCVPSLSHTFREDWENTAFYGDEIDGSIGQALFLNKDPDNLDRFEESLEACDRGALMSGTVYDHHVEYIRALCPTEKVPVIQNTYRPERPKVTLLAGTSKPEDPTKINKRDRFPLTDRILSDTAAFAVQSDSKHFLETVDRVLKGVENIVTLLVTADTLMTDDRVTPFLENPNRYIESFYAANPDKRLILLASPTMTSGNDITAKYFKRDYHYYCGQLSAVLISQKIIRIRDNDCERIMSIAPFVTGDDTETCNYLASLYQSLENAEINALDEVENKSDALSLLRDAKESPHYKEAVILKWIRRFERQNYRECVIRLLRKQGYEIEELIEEKTEPGNGKPLKEASEQIKSEVSEGIYLADDRFVGKDERSINPKTAEDLRAIDKAKIVSMLPGIHETDAWTPELTRLLTFDDRNLVRKLNRRYLLEHPETLERLTATRYHKHARRIAEGKTATTWKNNFDLAFLTAIGRLKVPIPVDPDDITRNDETVEVPFKEWIEWAITRKSQFSSDSTVSPSIAAIVSQCQKKATKDALGRAPGLYPIKFVGWLIGLLGYRWDARRVRLGSELHWRYSIAHECDNETIRTETAAAIERRYRSLEEKCTTLDWDFSSVSILPDFSEVKTTSEAITASVSSVLDRANPPIERDSRKWNKPVLLFTLSENTIDSLEPTAANCWGYALGDRVEALHEGCRWVGLTVEYGYADPDTGRAMLALRMPDGTIGGFPLHHVRSLEMDAEAG